MTAPHPDDRAEALVTRLRAAGCVFAEDDAVVLLGAARGQWPAADGHAHRAGWSTVRHDHPDVPTCVLALRRTVAA